MPWEKDSRISLFFIHIYTGVWAVSSGVLKRNWYDSTRLAKSTPHFLIQSEVKLKQIVILSRMFSRALRQLHVITSSFDWFIVLSVSFVIG